MFIKHLTQFIKFHLDVLNGEYPPAVQNGTSVRQSRISASDPQYCDPIGPDPC